VVSKASIEHATKEGGPWLLMATASGLGKRVPLSHFRLSARGTYGVFCIKLADKDSLVSLHEVNGGKEDGEDCLVATKSGMMIRTPVSGFNIVGRQAKGVRVVRMQGTDLLSSVTPCRFRHYSVSAVELIPRRLPPPT
jgi:DNA gyrase subunit A